MRKLTTILILTVFTLASCEKGDLKENALNNVNKINHNSYVISGNNSSASEIPEFVVTKNGIVQNEQSLARVFCKEENFDLIAGQNTFTGFVTISNDAENMYVTYKSQDGWKISEIHLYAGSFAGVPVNSHNVPVPGQFPVKESFNPGVEMVTYEIPLKDLPECPYILAHAVVSKDGESETAWGRGTLSFEEAFDISRWGWVMTFCPEKCEGKELVIGLKSYVADPLTYKPDLGNHVWWVVAKGEGSVDNCLSLGFNKFNTAQTGSSVYDLIKWGRLDEKVGTMKVYTSVENETTYLNVILTLDDEALDFAKSYLYVGSEDGLASYRYIYQEKECFRFYEWFFQNDVLSNPKTFRIALSDIKE